MLTMRILRIDSRVGFSETAISNKILSMQPECQLTGGKMQR